MTTTPKGWRQSATFKNNPKVWRLKSNEREYIQIVKEEKWNNWEVQRLGRNTSRNILGLFKTKAEAESFAIRWMRQHPNG